MNPESTASEHLSKTETATLPAPKPPTTIAFWEENVRWYDLWLRHNHYHEPVVRTLNAFVRPRWRVLDIGGGTGVLSRPLAEMGCTVTMLEPCPAMVDLLTNGAAPSRRQRITIDPRRWEDVGPSEYEGWDLIVASNSLHLAAPGLDAALQGVLNRQPRHALIVSEYAFCRDTARVLPVPYSLGLRACYTTESSFSYRSETEALEHFLFRSRWCGGESFPQDRLNRLTPHGGRLIDHDAAFVRIHRFDRYDTVASDCIDRDLIL